MKRLIVNADDFGLTDGVNRAVVECHEAGAVSSTTLLVAAGAAEAAARLAAGNPSLGVGLHLNLTSGRPVLPHGRVRSLVASSGGFPGPAGALLRLSTGYARTAELEAEIEAQLLRCRELGITPTHIDSHHHLHAHPRLRSIIQRVCPGYGITRARGYHLGSRSAKSLAVRAAFLLPSRGKRLKTPDRFSGMESMGRNNLAELLARELGGPGDTLEFMCHPGHSDRELAAVSSFSSQRETELAALVSPGFRQAIEAAGVRLISFGEL